MAQVKFKRGNKQFIDNLPIVDGQLIYNTETGETFEDVGSKRISTTVKVDAELSETSENPVQNKVVEKAISELSAKKSDKLNRWELIERVTTTESAIFNRTAEPDGTEYNFDAVCIMLEKELSNRDGGYWTVTAGGTKVGVFSWISETEKHAVMKVVKFSNMYLMQVISGKGNEYLNVSGGGIYASAVTDNNINRIYTNNAIPSGSKIEIWGVRA